MISHDRRVVALALAGGAPAVVFALLFLWTQPWPTVARVASAAAVLACWLGAAAMARRFVVHPLQTISNLLAALREEDFSIRARGGGGTDALGHVMF
jgi:two-component system nitrogen regulation sensor histidine kinase NtrY